MAEDNMLDVIFPSEDVVKEKVLGQQCTCSNTYHYKDECIVCGAEWFIDTTELVVERAKEYYSDHMNQHNKQGHYIDDKLIDVLWKQCSKEYRDAWITIASADFED